MSSKIIMKNILWGGLYLLALLVVVFSIVSFSEKDLNSSLLYLLLSIIIFTFLIIKDLKFFSLFSFIIMIPTSLIILGIAGEQIDGVFASTFDEKAFLLSFSLILCFFIVNCTFWLETKHNWKKTISKFLMILSFLALFIFSLGVPNYHQNFVYSRIFILILLIYSVFLIVKHKKGGKLGIIFSIGLLLLSAGIFAGEVYVIEGDEWNAVFSFIDPKAKETFEYYNENDFNNFCKYCSLGLKNSFETDSVVIKDWRNRYGKYLNFGEPEIIRTSGFYYIEYPVKFQNAENSFYLTFMLSDISPDSPIYGFNLSEEKGQIFN